MQKQDILSWYKRFYNDLNKYIAESKILLEQNNIEESSLIDFSNKELWNLVNEDDKIHRTSKSFFSLNAYLEYSILSLNREVERFIASTETKNWLGMAILINENWDDINLFSNYNFIKEFKSFNELFDKLNLILNTANLSATQRKTESKEILDNKTLDKIKASENHFLRGIPMEAVINHFKPLTEKKSKNGNTFLTQDQFYSFLQRAFLNDKKQLIQKLNLASGEKGFVIKRFYQFYDMAVSKYGDLNKKEKYIKLLSENFDNWNYETIEPFFKSNKTKGEW